MGLIFRKLSEFRRCILRVQFPDRHIVQCVFLSGETVSQVKAFLRESILIPSESPFELFVTPPKTVLRDDDTLLDAGCVPSSVVYVDGKCQIREELLEKKSNLAGAQEALKEASLRRRQEREAEEGEQRNSGGAPASSSTVESGMEREAPAQQKKTVPDTKSGNKVPKWLMRGKQ